MQGIDYWRLCNDLSVVQTALLIVGENPSGTDEFVMDWKHQYRPEGFDAVFTALKNAILSKTLHAKIIYGADYQHHYYESGASVGEWEMKQQPDWKQTTINVFDIREWLERKGIKTGFFFPQGTDEREYLNKDNPHYAPKLAAAVRAWEAIKADQNLLRGKTPKQALAKFLRQSANEYGLTKEDGSPNEDGIEQICKVANWKPEGGAAKTPSPMGVSADPPTPQKIDKNQMSDATADEEIPF